MQVRNFFLDIVDFNILYIICQSDFIISFCCWYLYKASHMSHPTNMQGMIKHDEKNVGNAYLKINLDHYRNYISLAV